jgi:hypothetical protein
MNYDRLLLRVEDLDHLLNKDGRWDDANLGCPRRRTLTEEDTSLDPHSLNTHSLERHH